VTQDLTQAAVALAATLVAENQALIGLDFRRAAALLDEKRRAADAFAAAAQDRQVAADVVTRLRDLAAENKRLLERAVLVQGRVIGAVVRAIPKVVGGVPRYGAGGAFTGNTRMRPMALSARA
jgi:hypothetical protein